MHVLYQPATLRRKLKWNQELTMFKTKIKIASSALATSALLVTNILGASAISSTQTRHYDVLIDGKKAGDYTLAIAESVNTTEVTSNCTVHFKVLLFNYNYKYHGRESYKDDKLTAFISNSDDNGKRNEISLKRADDGSLHFTSNNKSGITDGATILSSYWSFPLKGKAATSSANLKILEVDSGRIFKDQIKFLKTETLNIAGKPTECKHYDMSGGDDCELWYVDDRLVRQKSSNLGRTTVVELVKLD